MNIILKSFKHLKWYEWIMFAAMIIIGGYYAITTATKPVWYNAVNFCSSIFGLCCIFLTAHASRSNFIFSVVNTILYCIILFYNKIYGTFALEVLFYLPTSIFGFFAWKKHQEGTESDRCKTRRLKWYEILIMLALLLVSTTVYYLILKRLGGNTAFLDAMVVAIGIIATIYELKRFGDQYLLWIITDVVTVIQWSIIADPIMITKRSIYLIMAVIGIIRWRKLSYERNKENI